MFYHRVMEGPIPVEHAGQKIVMFTLLQAAGEDLDETGVAVAAVSHDLSSDSIHIIRMIEAIEIHFDDKVYEYRTHLTRKQFFLVEAEN